MRGEELLLKFIKKGLSSEERFELEKLALEDDFLFEAWKGVLASDKEKVQSSLNQIISRLSGDQTARVVPLHRRIWPYAVAASLLLVFALSILLRSSQDVFDEDATILVQNDEENNREEEVAVILEGEAPEVSEPVETFGDNSIPSDKEQTPGVQQRPVASEITPSEPIPISSSTDASTDDMPNELTQEDLYNMKADEKPMSIPGTKDIISGQNLVVGRKSKMVSDTAPTQLQMLKVPDEAATRSRLKRALVPETNTNKRFDYLESEQSSQEDVLKMFYRDSSGTIIDIQMVDLSGSIIQSDAQPLIGFDAFNEVMRDHSDFGREDFFMIGWHSPYLAKMMFDTDEEGNPIGVHLINLIGDMADRIVDLFNKGGKWTPNQRGVRYDFNVPLKKPGKD